MNGFRFAVLAPLCKHACSESTLTSVVRSSLIRTSAAWGVALERTGDWARGYYGELVEKVLTDLQVFLGTNCVLLVLAGVWLFSRYVGSAYITWVALIAAILLDCVFNKGRITHAAIGALTAPFHS